MSEPSKPADSGNKPLDLKSRLSLKTQAAPKPAEATPAAPVAGAALPPPPQAVLPPPPVQKPKVEVPTAETIAEARRRAEALAADAGPAIEEFSIGGAPEKTPVPVAGVRVEYIDAGPAEIAPEVKKKQRFVLIGAVVAAALIAFFLGKALSSADALGALKDNMVAEAQQTLRFIDANAHAFERIDALAKELKTFNAAAAEVAAGKKQVLELEAPMGELLGKVKEFVAKDDKERLPFVDPAVVLGAAVYNGDLMAQVLNLASRTQIAYQQAQAMLEEALALVAMWRPVVGDARSVRIFSDVEELDHPEGGKMPRGKGTIVTKLGPPTRVDVSGGTQEFQQMVLLVGQEDPIQVKTTQVTWTDLGPFFDDQLNGVKTISIGRLTVLTERLEKTLDACKPGPVKQMISDTLAKMGASAGAAPAAAEAPAK